MSRCSARDRSAGQPNARARAKPAEASVEVDAAALPLPQHAPTQRMIREIEAFPAD
jgi:hypothetical protein